MKLAAIINLACQVIFFTTSMVEAIPFTLQDNFRPGVFDLRADLMIMTVPAPEGFDSDMSCQMFYQMWWTHYRDLRSGRIKASRAYWVPVEIYKLPFTDYPDSVPVEAFAGEPLAPLKSGWRTGLYGCLTGCQDIRLTFEWIIAMYFEQKRHVRARAKFAFQCEEGLVALPGELRPSKREAESPSAVQSAIDSLETIRKTKTDKLSLYGEPSMVNKCTCVRPTGTQRALAQRLSKWGADTSGVHRRNYAPTEPRPAAAVTPRSRKGRRSEQDTAESSRSPQKKARPRNDADQDNHQLRVEVLGQDQIRQYEQMTCHDYNYPALPDIPDMAQLANPDELIVDHNPVSELVRAQLIALDFDQWYEGAGGSSGAQKSSDRKGY